MKKVIFIITIALTVLSLPPLTHAQMGMMRDYNTASGSAVAAQQKNLDSVASEVLKSQNVSSLNQLNCSKISQDQFEKVGDAWMGVMAGSEQNHSLMEQRLGGEGSKTLQDAHIQMGENYLGCGTGQSNNWMPMMGYGHGMMNGGFIWNFGWIAFLFWIVAFVDLVLLGIFLWKRISK